jgi:glycosyltransferase involved in cell wall biosynthesis
MRLMALVDYYLPGFKGGGPVRSVSRMIEGLAGDAECFVVTRDRDLGDTQPYSGIPRARWLPHGSARVFYADPQHQTARAIRAIVADVRPDVVYLNSYFSKFARVVLRLHAGRRLGGAAVVVAPRGEFSPGALQLKAAKKHLYLAMAGLTGLHRDITWHLTSDRERAEVEAALGSTVQAFISPPAVAVAFRAAPRRAKAAGTAGVAFISRIVPKKNLLGAIESLQAVRGEATLTIHGPMEDAAYWRRCQQALARLPPHVRVEYGGPLPHERVFDVLAHHHFLLLPTLGENFGHVIAEALSAGCPVLLSDQTPWMDLETRAAGWIIPLDDTRRWQDTVQQCVDMSDEDFQAMSQRARAYVEAVAAPSTRSNVERDMFEQAIELERSRAAR